MIEIFHQGRIHGIGRIYGYTKTTDKINR